MLRPDLAEVEHPGLGVSRETSLSVALKVQEQTQAFLLENTGDLTVHGPEAETRIIMRASAKALLEFGERRLAERVSEAQERDVPPENDWINRTPGIVVYATTESKDRVADFNRSAGLAEPTQVAPNLWAFLLPQGGYVDTLDRGVQFFDTISDIWETDGGGHCVFWLGYQGAVRVEGSSGELWQNPDFDWAGKPIPQQ